MAKKTNRGAASDIALMASSGAGTDLDAWLSQQGIGAEEQTEQKQTTVKTPDARESDVVSTKELKVTETEQTGEIAPQKTDEVSTAGITATGKTAKQRERYENQFFHRIEGFKKPTNMMYMSEKTYRLMAFLLRSSKESNAKITMPEIMENIINQHIKDNEPVLTQMQQEHLERLSKGF